MRSFLQFLGRDSCQPLPIRCQQLIKLAAQVDIFGNCLAQLMSDQLMVAGQRDRK